MCSASRYVLPGAGAIAKARWTDSGRRDDIPAAPESTAALFRKSRRVCIDGSSFTTDDPRLFGNYERYGHSTNKSLKRLQGKSKHRQLLMLDSLRPSL
jgi:hypothetical protein